ncbi:MAG: hypothetical protein E7177_06250 [Erysipelotrichaceae bacterium]|nr:hypothetical protein [Erysipelotrichaceae bacterium]
MKNNKLNKKTNLVLGIAMSSLILVSTVVSTFAYWQKDRIEVSIPTYEFNATEEEFTYYACIPNVVSTTGYDYYDLESIPTDLVDRVTALAAVRFEALTKTAYIPAYPKVTVGGIRYNYNNQDLPVIHILNSLSSDEAIVNNGFSNIETLIIPETITYIQPGSFSNSENLKAVSILGEINPDYSKDPEAKKGGYINYVSSEFDGVTVYKKDENRTLEPTFSINTNNLRFAQFGSSFEYDNKAENYYTFVVTGNSGVVAGDLMSGSPALEANTKYKLVYDGETLEAIPYKYEISLGNQSEELILNPNVNYEEYIIDKPQGSNYNVVRLQSHVQVEVNEYINNQLNGEVESTFNLSKLNAYYNADNTVFEIKYAPSHVYESIHYSGEETELVEEKTMTQISAEKVYFLNQVDGEVDPIKPSGEVITTVSVPNNDYVGLYVKAGYSAYPDKYYLDPTQNADVIKMELDSKKIKYQFEFKGSNNPAGIENNVSPNLFIFYLGHYNVLNMPDYVVEDITRDELQQSLTSVNHNSTRVYLQLYKDEFNTNSDITGQDRNGEYKWYLVYWTKTGVQKSFRVFYSDTTSTILIADIPNEADHFKFVRIDADVKLDDALKNDWSGISFACKADLKVNENNLFVFESKDYDTRYFNVTNTSNLTVQEKADCNRVYLQMNNPEIVTSDRNGEFKWYIAYWEDEGHTVLKTVRVQYTSGTSNLLFGDLPKTAIDFKFVRISKNVNIENAFTGNWENVTNTIEGDNLKVVEGKNRFTFSSWVGNNFYVTADTYTHNSFVEDQIRYGDKNENYLILTNYGENNTEEKYIPLDENLGYAYKDLDSGDQNSTYNLEFSKIDNYTSRSIQKIPLPKGTVISAKIENISASGTTTYYFNDVSFTNLDNVSIADDKEPANVLVKDEYFEVVDGKLVVKKDLVAEIYLKVTYSETATSSATEPNHYEWHFVHKHNVINGNFNSYDLNREVVSDENSTDIERTITTRQPGKNAYPWLDGTGNVIKLDRNFANKEYEEYRLLSDTNLSGSYVVSYYYETDRDFGGNTGSVYYGVINGTTPSGEIIVNNDSNVILFTPDGESSYDRKYYAAFDDHGNFLTNLTFNRTQTINEGYQVLSCVIPESLSDFRYVYIYEVDENNEIILYDDGNGGKIPYQLNGMTSLIDIVNDYNAEHGYTEGNQEYKELEIPDANDERLLFDFYLKEIHPASGNNDNADELNQYRTNSIGFSYPIQDTETDRVFYYYNVKLGIHTGGINTGIRYQIYTDTNFSHGITISNNDPENKLDEQIIDGYYYNDLHLTSDYIIRFQDTKFKEGYYNLVLRERTIEEKKYYYLGYQYLGPDDAESNEYYLHIHEVNDGVEGDLIEIIKMDSMNNDNHYFADVNFEGTYKFKVYDKQKILVYEGSNYTSTGDLISRFYYGVNTTIDGTNKLKQVELNKMVLNVNFGSHPLNEQDTVTDVEEGNIRYVPSSTAHYSENGIKYYDVKVKTGLEENRYRAKDDETYYLLDKHLDNYRVTITNVKFNNTISIYLGNNVVKTIDLPQPGRYEITYNPSSDIIGCYKLQIPDVFYLFIDEEMVAELEVNSSQQDYYEYVVKNHIVLETELNLSSSRVVVMDRADGLGNIVAEISKVTVDFDSTTIVDKGAYALTYSIDSSRREGDTYHVFTYLNFDSSKVSSTELVYNYDIVTIVDDNEVISAGEPISKTIINDGKWKFDILDFDTIENVYVPIGTYFVGWAESSDAQNATYEVGSTYSYDGNEPLELFPIFKDRSERHKVIWIKAPDFDSSGFAIFSLDNLETTNITGISYSGYDDYINGTNGKPKYVTINGNEVTVDQSLFEVIGYVEGGIKLVVHLQSEIDGKTSTCTVRVDYPNYDNRMPLTSTFETGFDEYNLIGDGDVPTNVTNVYKPNTNAYPSWTLFTSSIKENNGDNFIQLKLPKSTSYYGYALIDSMFVNIKQIRFEMSVSVNSVVNLRLELLDYSKEVVHYEVLSNESLGSGASNNGKPDIKTINLNIKGAYFVRFIIDVPQSDIDRTVNIDDVTIITGEPSYSSNFSSGDYSIIGNFKVNEELVEANNDYALNWKLYEARFGYENAYGNDGQDKSNLALILRTIGEKDGYAVTSSRFTSISTITFKLKSKRQVDNKLNVYLVDAEGNIVHTLLENKTTNSNDYIDVEINSSFVANSPENGLFLKFVMSHDSVSNEGSNMFIDNLYIKF